MRTNTHRNCLTNHFDTTRSRNIMLVVLHLILYITTQVSGIGGQYWELLMEFCIGGCIVFFILDVIITSNFYSKLQYKLTFYMIFPTIVSLVFYYIGEYNNAYNTIMINIVISIAYTVIYAILSILWLIMIIYEKYFEKVRIECDNCVRMYSVRIREYNKLRKYKYETKKGKCKIICQHCLSNDDKFMRLSLAPDFIKINHKAKLDVKILIEKNITLTKGE